MAWAGLAPFSYLTFLWLWLGYILALDGLNAARSGTSPLARSPARFLALFALSAPVWWLFEFLNAFVQNWHYLGGAVFGDAAEAVATVHFTTVIPAVFETAEFVASFGWVQRAARGRRAIVNRPLEVATFALGWLSFVCLIVNPAVSFSLTWLCVLMIVDPLNAWLGRPSLMRQAARGDWRNVLALGAAGLICGFCWELWNYRSYPKWYYTVPYVGFWKVFEMPLLGYGGYIPFAMELYALYQFAAGFALAVIKTIRK